jgi:hypothetical protein
MYRIRTVLSGDRIDFKVRGHSDIESSMTLYRGDGLYSSDIGWLRSMEQPGQLSDKNSKYYISICHREWYDMVILRPFMLYGEYSCKWANITKRNYKYIVREYFDDLHELRVMDAKELNVLDWRTHKYWGEQD